jgi:hypothetical protein
MPLIQIEQDLPEVIDRAREQLAQAVERAQRAQASALPEVVHGAFEYAHGYLDALYVHQLLSEPVHTQLAGELRAASQAASA